MKLLVAVALVALIHGSCAKLLIKGPNETVVMGDTVALDCMYSDSELNVSQVHFEVFYESMQMWRPVHEREWCFYTNRVERSADRITLWISYAYRYSEQLYRCASDAENVTESDSYSEALLFKVHYLVDVSLYGEGYRRYTGVPQDMKVRLGDDVTVYCSASSSEDPSYSWQKGGSDWILPSSQLTIEKVSASDEGQYTCTVKHPLVSTLVRKRTFNLIVLPEDASWYETSQGLLILMTSSFATLLVLILAVTVFLICRAKRAKTAKGPIDDHSQKKPIYKSSAESLPSTCADKQPLV